MTERFKSWSLTWSAPHLCRYKAITHNQDQELVRQTKEFSEAMMIVQQSILASILQTNLEHTRADFKEELLVEQTRNVDANDEGWNQNEYSD